MRIDSIEAIPIEIPLKKNFGGSTYTVLTRCTIVTRMRTDSGLVSEVYNGDNREHGREIVRLDLEMSVGAPDPHDAIVIQGDPPLDVVIRDGGTHGDRGTVGTTLSAIPAVIAAAPGLKTILDLALVA